eukprot:CAMPEP_0114348064 /NCGR_PEP_ID=MMETSP0101-20121206/14424_1 /TAXON_ID=38822 ORGANISM="Pteridomonas danica, Strain PT" /NCGR_SAMPLE_ID=MMETSP0101 /ASSEMBLY_ACC=CAM_ASM_000211 /LENGTH=468 /DNA_ID=CAMNT_0001485795 /DNA_START=332 /DNA_END=1738 /DNA_ORIENTATION=-
MTNDLLFNSVLKTNLNEVEGGGESSDDWSKVSDYKNYSLRCLPNFLFIGASKCGTSSMRSHLVSHPGVRFVRRMQTGAEGAEVHRFDRWDFMFSNYLVEQALEWGHAPRVHNASDPVIHYTPHYLFDPAVPMRVKSFYHYSLKFLVMVRNPTTRAVSSYWFKRPNEKGGSVRDFQRSVASEILLRRRYERCLATFLLNDDERLEWIGKNKHQWGIEKQAWSNMVAGGSNMVAGGKPLPFDSTSQDVDSPSSSSPVGGFVPWEPGHWQRKGLSVSERIAAEKQCLFKSIKVANIQEEARRSKQIIEDRVVQMGKTRAKEDVEGVVQVNGKKQELNEVDGQVGEKRGSGGGVLMVQHVAKGIYVEQIDRWFEVFEVKRKFFILDLDSFKKDQVATFDRICRFLGTRSVGPRAFATRQKLEEQLSQRYNEGANPDIEAIPTPTLKLLNQFYKPYTQSFFELIGQTFPWELD